MRKSFRDILNKNRNKLEAAAAKNSHYNKNGYATISKSDSWYYEDEWENDFKELNRTERRDYVAAP